MQSTVTLTEGMHFAATAGEYELNLDAAPEHGGKDAGGRPKELMLTALAGCTAMDVISILRKMRVEPEGFTVSADAELTEEHPRVFSSVILTYRFKGKDLPRDKLDRAIELSQDRYCGVSAMMKVAVPITTQVIVEDQA